jgi:hypothetical protein
MLKFSHAYGKCKCREVTAQSILKFEIKWKYVIKSHAPRLPSLRTKICGANCYIVRYTGRRILLPPSSEVVLNDNAASCFDISIRL